MEYNTNVRVSGEESITLSVAEFPDKYDRASRVAKAVLSTTEAFALAAKIIEAANVVLAAKLADMKHGKLEDPDTDATAWWDTALKGA